MLLPCPRPYGGPGRRQSASEAGSEFGDPAAAVLESHAPSALEQAHPVQRAPEHLGRGLVAGPFTVEGSLEPVAGAAPPHTAAEALDRSYPLARRASRMMEMTYHFGEAFERPGGDWEAIWYSLEFTMFGRSQAVRVRFPVGGGSPLVKTAFYRPVTAAL